ncbi:uncharacterized protein LOC123322717 [Coccinella septempunctata]|uniref:uncharacterized protein LOC123322717 n=1 Tax=Coccinella septempunctata TaxID=41139 RepID=UPI001D08433A|nr:uncharacterized protein LOC123322717 [Coccinella septempunctata]
MFEPVDVCFNSESEMKQWSINEETQALIVAGLCCIGGWVILSWFFQLFLYVLWPVIALNLTMFLFPSFKKIITEDYFHNYIEIIKSYLEKYSEGDFCYCY